MSSEAEVSHHKTPARPGSPSDVPHVLLHVFAMLSQQDRCSACLVCREWHHIGSHPSLWTVLDLHGMQAAGHRLASAVSQRRFRSLKEVSLEFAQGVEDRDLLLLKDKDLERVNLNACQKITDDGVISLASSCRNLASFSIYWNLKVTDAAVASLAENCQKLTELNLSGCKNITDTGLDFLAKWSPQLTKLNLTRCPRLTDAGLTTLLSSCKGLVQLLLYAVSSFTDAAFCHVAHLRDLEELDLCGMQFLTDEGLLAIAECRKLRILNLTWCVRITDVGLRAIGRNCTNLQSLSLYGALGVTDEGIKSLANGCSESLTTLDVNGCVNIKRRSKGELQQAFTKLTCFQVHS